MEVLNSDGWLANWDSAQSPVVKEQFCRGCKQSKPYDEFNKDRCRKAGIQSQCRECKRAAQRRDYLAKKSIYRERVRAARKADPRRRRAYQRVHDAIKRGDLMRPTECPKCYRTDQRIEAHHHKGYDPEHALDVVFVCGSCHREAEAMGVKGGGVSGL